VMAYDLGQARIEVEAVAQRCCSVGRAVADHCAASCRRWPRATPPSARVRGRPPTTPVTKLAVANGIGDRMGISIPNRTDAGYQIGGSQRDWG
jgi:hypothetical protein